MRLDGWLKDRVMWDSCHHSGILSLYLLSTVTPAALESIVVHLIIIMLKFGATTNLPRLRNPRFDILEELLWLLESLWKVSVPHSLDE